MKKYGIFAILKNIAEPHITFTDSFLRYSK